MVKKFEDPHEIMPETPESTVEEATGMSPEEVEKELEMRQGDPGLRDGISLQEALDRLPPEQRKYAEVYRGAGFDLLKLEKTNPDKVYRYVNMEKVNFARKRSWGWTPVSDPDRKEITPVADRLLNQLDSHLIIGDVILCERPRALQEVVDRMKEQKKFRALSIPEEQFIGAAQKSGIETIKGAPERGERSPSGVGSIGEPVAASLAKRAPNDRNMPQRDQRVVHAKKTIYSIPGMSPGGKRT